MCSHLRFYFRSLHYLKFLSSFALIHLYLMLFFFLLFFCLGGPMPLIGHSVVAVGDHLVYYGGRDVHK
jgi:hypothetical protein